MNLKKSLIVSILVIALVCLLTVNVNAATYEIPATAMFTYPVFDNDWNEVEPAKTEAISVSIDLPEGVSVADDNSGKLSILFPELDEYHEMCPGSPVYVIPSGFDGSAGVNLTNLKLVGASESVNAKMTIKLPSGYNSAKLVKYHESEVIEIPSTSSNGTITFDATINPEGDTYCFYAWIYLAKGGAQVPAGDSTRAETVAEDVFAAAKANGTPVTVSVPGLATWNFPTVSNVMAFNPNLVASTTKMAKVQSTLIEEAEFIDFEHNGVLPGKATVTVNIGTERFGTGDKTLFVYYYNPSNKGFEKVGTAAYSNGAVTMELDHCSTYALMENELVLGGPAPEAVPAPAPAATGALDKEPKAGEMFILPVAILSVISLGVVAIINKK